MSHHYNQIQQQNFVCKGIRPEIIVLYAKMFPIGGLLNFVFVQTSKRQ